MLIAINSHSNKNDCREYLIQANRNLSSKTRAKKEKKKKKSTFYVTSAAEDVV